MAALARKLASKLAARPPEKSLPAGRQGALVIGLVGELGTGKTTFIQSFLKALGVKERVTSPTFILLRPYVLPSYPPTRYAHAHHIDTYRLDSAKELLAIGFKKIIREPGNIVLVEWADRFKKIMPKNTFWIKIEHGEKPTHRIIKHDL